MKRFLAMLLVSAFLICGVAFCEEATDLKEEAIEFFQGVYVVGVDISAGRYTITEKNDGEDHWDRAWLISVCNDESGAELYHDLGTGGTVSITLADGDTLKAEPRYADVSTSHLFIAKSSPLFMD